MSADIHEFHRSLVERYNAEYLPLEALLVCIIDALPINHSISRNKRIRDTLRMLTDIDRERIDDPSDRHGRALYRMAEYQQEEGLAMTKPEYGGITEEKEIDEFSAVSRYAKRAALELNLNESDIEILRKKFAGTYGTDPRANGYPYTALPAARLDVFDPEEDLQMLADFKIVASILKKYGIKFCFDKVFFRSLGKVTESVPKTT